MLRPRIIPCLLVKNRGLVKTQKFSSPKYVGDPINAVKVFNEKQVDELIVLDIDASAQGREPDYTMIRNLAAECRMPLCYGGGVKTVEQAAKIIGLGVEKVAVSSAAVESPELISKMAEVLGNQSVVVVMDVRQRTPGGEYVVCIRNGGTAVARDPVELARDVASRGAGEIVVNSIDRDGVMNGYDTDLIAAVRNAVSVPITAVGGAGSIRDIAQLIARFGIIGAAAGSLFVFKGPFRAVLISYPGPEEKASIVSLVPT